MADPGGAAGARPPSRFFRFDIQIFRNVAASGVGAPLRGRAPLREILDPLLVLLLMLSISFILLVKLSWCCCITGCIYVWLIKGVLLIMLTLVPNVPRDDESYRSLNSLVVVASPVVFMFG